MTTAEGAVVTADRLAELPVGSVVLVTSSRLQMTRIDEDFWQGPSSAPYRLRTQTLIGLAKSNGLREVSVPDQPEPEPEAVTAFLSSPTTTANLNQSEVDALRAEYQMAKSRVRAAVHSLVDSILDEVLA